jgi:hypothetical protein
MKQEHKTAAELADQLNFKLLGCREIPSGSNEFRLFVVLGGKFLDSGKPTYATWIMRIETGSKPYMFSGHYDMGNNEAYQDFEARK